MAAFALLLISATAEEPELQSIFDGNSLDGWHISSKTGHSRASKHETGGSWAVKDGAIIGS